MIANPFGYVTVILVQQVFIIGLVWSVVRLWERSRRERRRYYSAMLLSNAAATNDLAALAVRLSRTSDSSVAPVSMRSRGRIAQEESV